MPTTKLWLIRAFIKRESNMSRIFTPSERSRRNTNPQPVNNAIAGSGRSRYLVIFKNIIGAPIPLLWVLLAPALFIGYPIHTWIALAIACCTALYIVLDRFSHAREFYFFSLGIEIPSLLVLIGFSTSLWLSGDMSSSQNIIEFISWVALIYLMSFSLNLFPGLNRFFTSFTISGIAYSLFSLWQYFTKTSVLWANNPPDYFDTFRTGLSLLTTPHAICSGLLVLFCLSFFVFKNRKLSFSGVVFFILLISSGLSLLISQNPLAWTAFIIPFGYYSLFLSRKVFRDLILSALLIAGGYFAITNIPGTADFFPQERWIEEANLEKEFWREEFENFNANMWLGKSVEIEKIEFLGEGISENQIFFFESNYYLHMLTQNGILLFLFMSLFFLVGLFRSISLLKDVPPTHHWHKVFVFFLTTAQVFYFVAYMTMTPWYSSQILVQIALIYAIVFYMGDAYTKQIVPDDHSL